MGDKLGRGKSGEVYNAWIGDHHTAAKKFLNFHNFERELAIHTLYLPSQTDICRVVAYDTKQRILFFPVLADKWTPLSHCQISKVVDMKALLLNLASSVYTLHTNELTHNDLKGDNFMTDGSNAVLIDFGNATHMDDRYN